MSRVTRARYRALVTRILRFAGDDPAAAAGAADAVMRVETALAKASLDNVASRDARNLKHPMSFAALQELTPHFNWKDYLAGLSEPAPAVVNVAEPKFFKAVDKLIKRGRMDDLRAYLRWQVAGDRAEDLSSAFVKADFDFYDAYLRGAKELPPRWKTCVGWVDDNLGESLGKVFVEKTFTPEMKSATADMVKRIEAAMDRRIRELPWMGEETKRKALEKLAAMKNKIGYPDTWRDYSSVVIRRDDFAGNSVRAGVFEAARQLKKIGHPTDRNEWGMTPPTVNAYYDGANNDMNFPAGVLLPPLFDPKLDAAPNYGNTGGTIGHELTHGFDDDGRHFDARGNLVDWWTAADAAEFERRAACIVDQYGAYPVVDDLKINSRLTLGEDLADLGGLIIAWEAWKDLMKEKGQSTSSPPIDGLTPEQRFFVGFAQWDCSNDSPESLRLRALTNPHSPSTYRINGVVVNMPEYGAAFSCPAGSPMVKDPSQVCRVW
jgi:endothelin-converting enzyme/putative endopeptidase